MKYIEEINNGQIFYFENKFYVLSADLKKNNTKNKHMCIQINSGLIRWLDSDTMIEIVPVFYQDKENILHNIYND